MANMTAGRTRLASESREAWFFQTLGSGIFIDIPSSVLVLTSRASLAYKYNVVVQRGTFGPSPCNGTRNGDHRVFSLHGPQPPHGNYPPSIDERVCKDLRAALRLTTGLSSHKACHCSEAKLFLNCGG